MAALRFVVQQYAVRVDVLQVLLGRLGDADARAAVAARTGHEGRTSADRVSLSMARSTARRWERAGWVRRAFLLGHLWVIATGSGTKLAGIEPRAVKDEDPPPMVMEPWEPRARMLGHVHAVTIVRLHLEMELQPGQRWVSERELRRELARERERRGVVRYIRHTFDGAVEGAAGERQGIEVELTAKSPALFREALRRPVTPDIKAVTYYAPARLVALLQAHVQELGARRPTTVHPLPELGLSYMEG